MSAKSLLPCSCGKKIEVEISQAGLLVDCPACGQQVQTPTLRGFRELDTAEAPQSSAPSGSEWGKRQGLVFLGLMITAIGLIAATIVWWTAPVFNPEIVLQRGLRLNSFDLQSLSPADAYAVWDGLTTTIDDPNEQRMLNAHYAVVRLHYRWMWIALGVCAVGLIVVGSGYLVGSSGARNQQTANRLTPSTS